MTNIVNNKSSLGIIGDMHNRQSLPYSDYVKDNRIPEKQKILDTIVKSLWSCDKIIFLGDIFDIKNPDSETIKEFVNFLERFKQPIYIVAGNHEKMADGRTSLDFLKEIKNKSWHVVTNKIETINNITFVPYFTKAELGVETEEEGTKKIMSQLKGGEILVVHHTISDIMTNSVINTNLFREIVLPQKELEKKYNLIIGGHIHKCQMSKTGQTLIAGSIFTHEVGEIEKFVHIISKQLTSTPIKLPCREIHKLEDPTEEDLKKLPKNSIVKVVITKKLSTADIISLKEVLKDLFSDKGAYLFIEQVPHERKKLHYSEGESILEYSIEQLLEIYAKEKKVDINKLQRGFELISK